MAQMDAGELKLDRSLTGISDLLSDTIERFRAMAEEKRITLSGLAAPGVDPVYIDARQISRVLANLVSNALRHTPRLNFTLPKTAQAAAGYPLQRSMQRKPLVGTRP